jgi:hypothetical protein
MMSISPWPSVRNVYERWFLLAVHLRLIAYDYKGYSLLPLQPSITHQLYAFVYTGRRAPI